jgi:hypothetical protein
MIIAEVHQALRWYISQCRPEIAAWIREPGHINELFTERKRTHPGVQRLPGGLAHHTLQTLRMALQLNQECAAQELIECLLVHDIHGSEGIKELTDAQRLAIDATKGRAQYKQWRPTPHVKFVVLVLIADMWSAFLNEDDLIVEEVNV